MACSLSLVLKRTYLQGMTSIGTQSSGVLGGSTRGRPGCWYPLHTSLGQKAYTAANLPGLPTCVTRVTHRHDYHWACLPRVDLAPAVRVVHARAACHAG